MPSTSMFFLFFFAQCKLPDTICFACCVKASIPVGICALVSTGFCGSFKDIPGRSKCNAVNGDVVFSVAANAATTFELVTHDGLFTGGNHA